MEMLAVTLLLYLLALGPTLAFAPWLLRQRHHGLYTCSLLASEHVIGFEKKWMGGQRPENEALVRTADIQSLADLANSFAIRKTCIKKPFFSNRIPL